MTSMIGWMAAAVSTVMFLPQLARTWRHRHNAAELAGISVFAFLLIVLNGSLWLAYGALKADLQMMSSNGFVVLAAVGTLLIVLRGRARARSAVS